MFFKLKFFVHVENNKKITRGGNFSGGNFLGEGVFRGKVS